MDSINDQKVRRMVRQQLESFQRAGLTHIRHVEAAKPERVSTPQPVATRTNEPPPPTSQVTSSKEGLFAEISAPTPLSSEAPVTSAETFSRCTLSREERVEKLSELSKKVSKCRLCEELANTRTQTVFGVGDPEANIMFVGEAPGADEDRQGEPFVGRAGQLLNKIIEACGMKREQIYICNILRCRPPGNRNPTSDEAANCRPFLDGQIQTIDPDYIVCWGSVAAQNLLDTTAPIGRLRGSFKTYGRAKVLCTYHPSYLLRNPSAKKPVWEDMQFLFADMGIDLKT